MACEKKRGGNESSHPYNFKPSNIDHPGEDVAEQRETLQSPLKITIALTFAIVAVVAGSAVTSTIAEAVTGAAAGAATGAGILQSLWEAEARRGAVTVTVIVTAVAGGLAGTAGALLQSLLGVHSLTGSAITGAMAGAAIVAVTRRQLQLVIDTIQWVIVNLQWVVDLVKRVKPALPAATRFGGSGLAAATLNQVSKAEGAAPGEASAGAGLPGPQQKGLSPAQSTVMTEGFSETDKHPKTDEPLKANKPPKTVESPKEDKPPKKKESTKKEEFPKIEESPKTGELPSTGKPPKTAVENAQKNIITPCQSAVNNNQKMSRETASSKIMRKDHSNGKGSSVAHDIKNKWSRKLEVGSNKNLPMFKLNLDETWKNSNGFCRRSTFGKNITKENKTIMMIGATGAGKTTLINSMINYILGVQWKDNFRFVLIDEGKQKSQAESQTSLITAYQINYMDGFRVPYSLTIVDTPGFGDTRGIEHDQKITAQIQEFFSFSGGINCIDAVGFVVQASLARLTHTQKYVFDTILSIFGKDIAQNILVLVTFADGKRPPVLEAIKVAEVPCSTTESGEPLHFKFNNSALFATNNTSADDEESDCENFDEHFWRLGVSSMKKFFTSLITMKTQSLVLTQEVLKERQQLEVHVQGLQPQINAGLTKLDEIKKTRVALVQHKAEMDANKDFEYDFEITVPKQIQNNTNNYLTNCQKCNFTCHDACAFADDRDKHMCMAMKDGNCRICPGKCVWNVHFNQKYKWVYVPEKRKGTYLDLKKRFEEAHGQIMSKEKISEELEKKFQDVQDIVTELIEGSKKSLERLQEIALKPNPLSTPDYIDLMIESEKQEAKPGFLDRIQSLREVRKKAEITSKVSTGEVLPDNWKDYKPEIIKRERSFNPMVLFNNAVTHLRKK